VAAVLALAALMPDFRLLNTSPDGLALIADLEGCRLTPYQCSAGVWTSGIGHTAGVVPKRDITEREAAANLVADVLNTERRLAVCVPVTMPQPVYDALVSFSLTSAPARPVARRWSLTSSVISGGRHATSSPAGCTSMALKTKGWKTAARGTGVLHERSNPMKNIYVP
jgi:hypothetical protein